MCGADGPTLLGRKLVLQRWTREAARRERGEVPQDIERGDVFERSLVRTEGKDIKKKKKL
jgi:hypothetical protein